MTKLISEILNEPEKMPDWLVEGIASTTKTKENKIQNYRPLHVFPTICKMITSTLSERIVNFIHCKDIFPLELKG